MRLYTHTHTHTHGHSKERGITLIALVVTIVVLLILAGVSLNLILGNNGIITKAKESRTETRMAQIDELVNLAIGDAYTDGIGSITDSGLKSALNNRLGEGTYDISGDETTGWKVTVKETGKTYDITANGKSDSSGKSGTTVDWDAILEDAKKNPEKYKDEKQSGTNGDIGIGTDGLPVNMDLWRARIINGNEIALNEATGCGCSKGYVGKIIDGKIQGKIPEYVKKADKDDFYRVTSMQYTFLYCTELEEMQEDIPSGVTNFDHTFIGCSKLTKVIIPHVASINGENLGGAFNGCGTITAIRIPKDVESIDVQFLNYYFDDSLQAIDVDEKNAYYSSENGVLLDKEKKTIIAYPAGKTEKNYEIKSGVTSIGEGAFSGCKSLTSVVMPDTVTSIGEGAFFECSSLTSVTISDSVTVIGDYVFSECVGLTSITIPDSVTLIGDGAFSGCESLTSVTIPAKVENIGGASFGYCSSLKSIEIDEKNKNYLSENGIIFSKEKKVIIAYPAGKTEESYNIPNIVTSIGDGAFSGCSSLTSITIPDSVTAIEDYAFYGCSSLTSVTIPDSITSISNGAFLECTSLMSVAIPDSVTAIEDDAFSGCSSLTSITIPDSVTAIEDYAFSGCSSLTSITIPKNVSLIGYSAFYNCNLLADVYFEETTTPDFSNNSFYKNSGVKTTLHFKNQEVYDAFTESYYNKNYGEKSTDFNW